MRQETLDGYQVDEDRICPTCGKVCADKAGVRRHHGHVHDESISKTMRTCRVCGDERELYESELDNLEKGDLCQTCASERTIPHTEESKRKISKTKAGMDMPQKQLEKLWDGRNEYFKSGGHDEETLLEIAEASAGRKMSVETRRKISDTLTGHEVSKETRQKIRESLNPAGVQNIEVGETEHVVKSGWEREIDLLLHHSEHDHEYEPEQFDIGGRTYTPDFRVGDCIIEVKGYDWGHAVERARGFMQSFPEKTYIVVGTELPSDVHIPWNERERLLSVL